MLLPKRCAERSEDQSLHVSLERQAAVPSAVQGSCYEENQSAAAVREQNQCYALLFALNPVGKKPKNKEGIEAEGRRPGQGQLRNKDDTVQPSRSWRDQ